MDTMDTMGTMGKDTPYPETLIIVITAHGWIDVDTTFQGRKEPDIFGIPYGMTLTRINAVAPGVCNYLSEEIAKEIVEKTKDMAEMYDLANISGVPSEFAPRLAREIKLISSVDKQDINSQDKKGAESARINYYNIHYNKAYTTSTHTPYTFALNKTYSVYGELSKNYDDKILLVNTPQGELDYFTTLQPPYEVDLKTLVHNLAEKGVKNIILIDLSCAVFDDKRKSLTTRDERAMRREARGEGWMGGRKHTKKSKKIKQTNKQTKKSKHTKQNLKRNRRTRKLLG
jgi:hypothetical protein